MKASKIFATTFVALALVGGTLNFAEARGMMHGGGMHNGSMGGMMGGGMMGGGMMGGMHHGMFNSIKSQLSAEQATQFDTMVNGYIQKTDASRQALFVKSQELQALQNAVNPDVKAVNRAATELAQLSSAQQAEHQAFIETVKKTFNLKELPMGGCMMGGNMGGMNHGGMMQGGMNHQGMMQGGMNQQGMMQNNINKQ